MVAYSSASAVALVKNTTIEKQDSLLPCQKSFVEFGAGNRFHLPARVSVLGQPLTAESRAYSSFAYFAQYAKRSPVGWGWQAGVKMIRTPFQVKMPFEKSEYILEKYDDYHFELNMSYVNAFLGVNHQMKLNNKWKLRSECSIGLGYLINGTFRIDKMFYYNIERGERIEIATIDYQVQTWNPDIECTFMVQRNWRDFTFGVSAGIQSLLFNPTVDRITYTLQPNTSLEVTPSRLSFPLQLAVGHNFCNLPKSRYADGWYE